MHCFNRLEIYLDYPFMTDFDRIGTTNMDIVEHTTPGFLITFIDEACRGQDEFAGLMRIKRNALKPMTDQAFVHAIRPALSEAEIAHVFFVDGKRIFIAWSGQKPSIYRHVRTIVGTT